MCLLTSPLTTAIYEQQLEDILNHRFSAEQFNKNLDDLLNSKLDIIKQLIAPLRPPAKPTGEKCPECAGDIIEREGKVGKFKSCGNYPKCKYNPAKVLNQNKPKAEATAEICPDYGLALLKRIAKASGKSFLGCSGFPKCNFVKWQ